MREQLGYAIYIPLEFQLSLYTEILTVIDFRSIYNKRNHILCSHVEESIWRASSHMWWSMQLFGILVGVHLRNQGHTHRADSTAYILMITHFLVRFLRLCKHTYGLADVSYCI